MRYWVKDIIKNDEQIITLESPAKKCFYLASNYPYEVYFDNMFVGSGGLRCAPGIVYEDFWDATEADNITINLHYLNSKKCSVWYRCLFDDPFFEDIKNVGNWSCFLNDEYGFAHKINSQLPKQNILFKSIKFKNIELIKVKNDWKINLSKISLPVYENIAVEPDGDIVRGTNNSFEPEKSNNIVEYLKNCKETIIINKYDMGKIALYKSFVDNLQGSSSIILVYSEIKNFNKIWESSNRKKVYMADVITPGAVGSPFGERGCRYIYIITKPNNKYKVNFLRRTYPLIWKDIKSEPLIDACKNNLIACVDGGVVDTCWRERAQWVGDLRMSAIALEKLTKNGQEIIDHALSQIATSYDVNTAMVQGAWPVKNKNYKGCLMPTYHLAYCLTVFRHSKEQKLIELCKKSLLLWKIKYEDKNSELIVNVPGWNFVDWDSLDNEAIGRNEKDNNTKITNTYNAVVNAWFYEACKLFNISSFDIIEYNKKFYLPNIGAYSMIPNGRPSIHATAAAIGSIDVNKEILNNGIYYIKSIKDLDKRVTMYYGYFIAKALAKKHINIAREFINKFYGPIANKYGTIYEKTSDSSSLAHGWSIGFIDFMEIVSKKNSEE